jgi:hypothetical protein
MSESIFISAKTLTECLNEAESLQSMRQQNLGAHELLGETVKKQKRQSTPAEELDEAREKRPVPLRMHS